MASALLLAPLLVAQLPAWIDRAPLPAPRQEVAVAFARGEVFVLGGMNNTTIGLPTVDAYDPGSDSWRPIGDLPIAVHHPMAAVVDDRLFLIGGQQGISFTPVDDLWEYDFGADQWMPRAPMPAPRGAGAAAVWDGRIYVAAGESSGGGSVTTFEVYDPVADQWSPLPDHSNARNHCGAAAVNGRIILVGGRRGSTLIRQTEIFDIASGQWSSGAPIPTGRGGIGVVEVLDRVVVLGGEGNPARPDGLFEEVEYYDPASDRWFSTIPMARPRHGIGAVSAVDPVTRRGAILIPGGANVQGLGAVTTNDALIFSY